MRAAVSERGRCAPDGRTRVQRAQQQVQPRKLRRVGRGARADEQLPTWPCRFSFLVRAHARTRGT